MSDLFETKQWSDVQGSSSDGPENFVIEVNGAERTVTREFWRASSSQYEQSNKPSKDNLDRLG
jgi:hypothetical protein